MSRCGGVWILFVAALSAPRALFAQGVDSAEGPVRGELGISGVLALPVGEFADYVEVGGGLSGFGVYFLDERQRVGLRLDGSWIVYGRNTVRRPLSPTVPFVDVKVTTQNGIGSFGFGPQFVLGLGPVRPYLRGSVGFSYFNTRTSVEGTNDSEPFASSTNFDDTTFALTAGGGVRVGLAEAGRHPVALDFGAAYMRHGLTEYLREGGLRETSGGGVEIEAIRSDTNLVTFYLGVSVGLR